MEDATFVNDESMEELLRVASATGGANITLGLVPEVDISDVVRLEKARRAARIGSVSTDALALGYTTEPDGERIYIEKK